VTVGVVCCASGDNTVANSGVAISDAARRRGAPPRLLLLLQLPGSFRDCSAATLKRPRFGGGLLYFELFIADAVVVIAVVVVVVVVVFFVFGVFVALRALCVPPRKSRPFTGSRSRSRRCRRRRSLVLRASASRKREKVVRFFTYPNGTFCVPALERPSPSPPSPVTPDVVGRENVDVDVARRKGDLTAGLALPSVDDAPCGDAGICTARAAYGSCGIAGNTASVGGIGTRFNVRGGASLAVADSGK
jgi:hypothetical protein